MSCPSHRMERLLFLLLILSITQLSSLFPLLLPLTHCCVLCPVQW